MMMCGLHVTSGTRQLVMICEEHIRRCCICRMQENREGQIDRATESSWADLDIVLRPCAGVSQKDQSREGGLGQGRRILRVRRMGYVVRT